MKPIIEYHYRGQVERGTGAGYEWVNGYSSFADQEAKRGILYPWMTRRECQREAKNRGAVAVFITSD